MSKWAAAIASAEPKFPQVAVVIDWKPRFLASSHNFIAIRSFWVPDGLFPSNFKYSRSQGIMLAIFLERVNVVLPTRFRHEAFLMFFICGRKSCLSSGVRDLFDPRFTLICFSISEAERKVDCS